MKPSLPFDLGLLKKEGIGYVVINYADRQRNTENFYKELKDSGVLVAYFSAPPVLS